MANLRQRCAQPERVRSGQWPPAALERTPARGRRTAGSDLHARSGRQRPAHRGPQDPEKITTVLEGIKAIVGDEQVEYVKGCAIRDTNLIQIKEAMDAAKRADVIVAVVYGI